MKDAYNYYVKIISPIEKKYTKACILYSIFKINFFKNRKIFYNKILIQYYKSLKTNTKDIKELEQHFNK